MFKICLRLRKKFAINYSELGRLVRLYYLRRSYEIYCR